MGGARGASHGLAASTQLIRLSPSTPNARPRTLWRARPSSLRYQSSYPQHASLPSMPHPKSPRVPAHRGSLPRSLCSCPSSFTSCCPRPTQLQAPRRLTSFTPQICGFRISRPFTKLSWACGSPRKAFCTTGSTTSRAVSSSIAYPLPPVTMILSRSLSSSSLRVWSLLTSYPLQTHPPRTPNPPHPVASLPIRRPHLPILLQLLPLRRLPHLPQGRQMPPPRLQSHLLPRLPRRLLEALHRGGRRGARGVPGPGVRKG